MEVRSRLCTVWRVASKVRDAKVPLGVFLSSVQFDKGIHSVTEQGDGG